MATESAPCRSNFPKIGLVTKPNHPYEQCDSLIDWLLDRSCEVYLESESITTWPDYTPDLPHFNRTNFPDLDLILVLGGDGTLIGASRVVGEKDVPLYAINRGKLGFLTDVGQAEMFDGLEAVFAGKYRTEERSRLEVSLTRNGEEVLSETVLNEVVISPSELARMVRLSTWVDDKPLTNYRADGLIISTPTGSTAYSLSAGGPIITPELRATIVLPICPHTLSLRPLIIDSSSVVEVHLSQDSTAAHLTLDGQIGRPMEAEDTVRITKAGFSTKLIRTDQHEYFEVLRKKLGWGNNLQ